ncbi:MAG TPA: hypothetical protein VL500_04010 [Candidatus Eisenbacteria bacterium]|nr:hypothetical protein [Candidatus Eisenbacteria bacterium]
MDDAKKTKRRWTPVMTGLAATAVSAGILLAAQFGAEGASSVWFIPVFCLPAGLLAAFFHARRLRFLLGGLLLGLLTGALSSFGLLGQPVEGLFFMVGATMTFFVTLGLLGGGFFEFVLFLHHLTHGRRPADYGAQKGE